MSSTLGSSRSCPGWHLSESDSVAPDQTPPPLRVEPSADGILHILSPTDASVFRSALAGIPLISHTPSFSMHTLPPLTDTQPDFNPLTVDTEAFEFSAALDAVHAKLAREHPVTLYTIFMRISDLLARLGRTDYLRYAARATLRLTAEELDGEMERSIRCGHASGSETFKPLVSYRLACVAALKPLVDLGHPPAELVRGYVWTWRNCATCGEHVEHVAGDACSVLCTDAPWFVELWKELIATLRARPDPDAVLGVQHLSQAMQGAMACPTCCKVAHEHLRCFQGLVVVEAAKRIAEVSFEP